MTDSAPRAGVLGLGLIGSRVAVRLQAAGVLASVWNRTPRTDSRLPAPCATPAEAAHRADILQIFVSDDTALRETIHALLPALNARHVVLSHSTVAPETVKSLADEVRATGADFLDAPFTGSRNAAANGRIVYYVSGNQNTMERTRSTLSHSAAVILPFGEIGTASAVKIATNVITAATCAALAEAVNILRSQKIDPQLLTTALEHNAARSGVTDLKLPGMIDGDFTPHFSARNMHKDLRLAANLTAPEKRNLIECVARLLDNACRRGFADDDFSILAKCDHS